MKTISIDELVEEIKAGATREQLKEKYGMNSADYKIFVAHPKIKGVKTGIAPSISFVDGPVQVDMGATQIGTNPNAFPSVDEAAESAV